MQNRLYGKFLRKAFAVLSPTLTFTHCFFGGGVKCLLFNTQSAVNVFLFLVLNVVLARAKYLLYNKIYIEIG